MKLFTKFTFVAFSALSLISKIQAKSTTEYLNTAQRLVSSGDVTEALSVYSEAINHDPDNFLIYVRRAILYINIGRTNSAIEDFSKIVNINPNFEQAYLKRGKLYLQLAELDLAKKDLEHYRQLKPTDSEVDTLIDNTDQSQLLIREAKKEYNNKNYPKAIEYLSEVIQHCPQSLELRKLRADSYYHINETEMAIGDYSRAVKLQPDNTDLLVKIGELHLSIGEIESSLGEVKECLRRDPEHKRCKALFKKIKKLDRSLKFIDNAVENKKWNDIVEKINDGLASEVETLGANGLKYKVYFAACKANLRLKKAEVAKEYCSKGLAIESQDVELLINRAEAFMLLEDYDAALRDYSTAHEYSPQDHRVMEGYQKAQRLQKMAKRKDYYKILGVKKTATKREIKKAYRKLAQIYHPDKYHGDMSKEQVEHKMSELNEAYEVLSDDETRERYDNGEDPNDPNGGGPGGNPFADFGFGGFGGFPFGNGGPFGSGGPFGGGSNGYQFKFNF